MIIQYQKIERLGAGGFGEVWLAAAYKSNLPRIVAIKQLNTLDQSSVKRFQREAKILASLKNHPYIVQILDYDLNHNPPYIVMEYFPEGSLDKYIRNKLNYFTALGIVKQVAQALSGLHKKGGFHRDIKPANIMVEKIDKIQWKVKLSDFGLSRDPLLTKEMTFNQAGTCGYIAPELQNGVSFSSECDVYSLGITFIQMLTGSTHPYSLRNHNFPQAVRDLVDMMIDPIPNRRPDVDQIITSIDTYINDCAKFLKKKQKESQQEEERQRQKELLANSLLGAGLFALGFIALENLFSSGKTSKNKR